MASRPQRRDRPDYGLAAILTCLVVAGSQVGCEIPIWPGFRNPPPPPCELSKNVTKAELIAHLNRRSGKLRSWRSNDVSIVTQTPRSIPMRLTGSIAVASPRRFRLIANSLMGREADFGSNDSRFWFWMGRSKPKHIFFANHTEIDAVQQRMPIPFRPDWVVDSLILAPLDPERVEMTVPQGNSRTAVLTMAEKLSNGTVVQRTMRVETCYGNVLQIALHDERGTTLATAEFNSYELDRESQIKLPRQIILNWPQQKVTMTLNIGHIDVNPDDVAPKTWSFPRYNGYQPFNMARDTIGGAQRPPGTLQHVEPLHRNRGVIPASGIKSPNRHRPQFIDEVGSTTPPRNKVTVSGQAKPFPSGDRKLGERPNFADD